MEKPDAPLEDERRAFIRSKLIPGAVLYLHCTFTKPPKNKYLLLACIDPQKFFIINSSLNPFVQSNITLLQEQVKIKGNDFKDGKSMPHEYSYIDCSQFCIVDDVYEQLLRKPSRIMGVVSERTIEKICNAVGCSETLSGEDIDIVLSSFRNRGISS
jgi:hypothetical protein